MCKTGHIRERSPGSFELRYSLGTDSAPGKRRTATVTVRGTRKDAEKEIEVAASRNRHRPACRPEPNQRAGLA